MSTQPEPSATESPVSGSPLHLAAPLDRLLQRTSANPPPKPPPEGGSPPPEGGASPEKRRRRQTIFSMLYLAGALVAMLLLHTLLLPHASVRRAPYSELLDLLHADRVAQVELRPTEVAALLKPNQQGAPPEVVVATRLPGIDESPLLKELEEHHVRFAGKVEGGNFWSELLTGWVLPLALMIGLYYWSFRRLGRSLGPLSLGRNQAKIYDQTERERVTFGDVAGVDEAKAELVEVVDFLKQPQKYRALGARIPKGVLLVGPPGTGKTLLARAVAGEAEVPFFSLSGSAFVEMFVGMGAARVRDLFEQAKQRAPCIVFIDEIDAIGKSRGGAAAFATHDEREQTLNQLLVEMDGFDAAEGVVLMAATNRPEVLDRALLRPGRFDRQVLVDRPDLGGREAILRVHARRVALGPGVDLALVARRTPGMVGADLANVVNEAALAAARRGATAVEQRDFEEAIDRAQLGLAKRGRVMSPEEKRRVAHHEAGHALVALSVAHADPVHRVTIVPRSIGALGATLQLPTEERYLMTRAELEDRLAVMMGGRAAEEIACGDISTGAQNDLERATETARQMVCRFGMSAELGPSTFGRAAGARSLDGLLSLPDERAYSEETARAIDAEVHRILGRAHERARGLLKERSALLARIAERLLEVETLDRDELDALLREEPGAQERTARRGVAQDASGSSSAAPLNASASEMPASR